MAKPSNNPLFTRSEKKRVRRKIAHKVKGAARKGFARLFGIPLHPGLGGTPATRRRKRAPSAGGTGSSSVRGDVLSALTGPSMGYSRKQAETMVPAAHAGEGFDSLFRRAVSKNPGELIIFGNPEKVYRRKHLKGKRNPLPAIASALVEGVGFTAGSKLAESATKGSRKRKGNRKRLQRNPDELGQAKDLYRQFHKRGPAGVFELQRSAKMRCDYVILGPLVALGVNAEKFDKINPREDDVVEHWDKLPHLAFLTGSQVNEVKRVLADPQQYLKKVALLASSPNGKQLYVITNEPQEINLQQFDTDTGKDYVDLGEATFVVYIAKKPHEVLEWVHTFGEDGGERPRLAYARIAKEVCFIGGSYRVEAPGIID